jgi:hypothetical protein
MVGKRTEEVTMLRDTLRETAARAILAADAEDERLYRKMLEDLTVILTGKASSGKYMVQMLVSEYPIVGDAVRFKNRLQAQEGIEVATDGYGMVELSW